MNVIISPHALAGRVEAVTPSKSQAHRALICAALGEEPCEIRGAGASQDVQATLRCLRALGAEIVERDGALTVSPIWQVRKHALLDCGESGSTLRFLLPVAAALGAECAFIGEGQLVNRPISPLMEQLASHGAVLSPAGAFPLTCGGRLRAGEYTLPGDVSSQFITGLMLALPRLPEESRIRLTSPLASRPYVDMTWDMLGCFGIAVEETAEGYRIPGNQRFVSPGTVTVEGDWSGAACWLAAGALGGDGVRCAPLNGQSRQGDRAIVDLLRRFGAEVQMEQDGVQARPGTLRGMEIDASDIPDLVPVLAVVGAVARGETRIHAISRLRLKESDRVEALLALLHALGIEAAAREDTLVIRGGTLQGGTVDAFHDHRIAMAAAVAASIAQGPVTVRGAECVDKSYPGFFRQFAALGGEIKEETP